MGCCSSKKAKDKVTEPQKQPEPESGVDQDARKAVQIKSSLDSATQNRRRHELDDDDDRARKLALEKAEEKRRKMAEKNKEKISRDKHSKLLSFVDDKYKNLQSLLIILAETLRNNDKADESVGTLMENIKQDAKDIEDALPDLQALPFPNDKEYLKNLRKIIDLVRELDLDYLSLKKRATKYPEYKENVLSTLQREYPELFDGFKGDESESSLRKKSESISPRNSSPHDRSQSHYRDRTMTEEEHVVLQLREADNIPKKMTQYDDAFDREMIPVVQQQKNEAIYELETAVQDYNRLLNDYNQLKQKQEYAQRDYNMVDQEAKELRDVNNQLSYYNDAIRVETGTLRSVQPELARNHDYVQQTTAALQRELMELRRQVQQREAENQQADREHQTKIQQLHRETIQRQQEAKEMERRYQEDLRKLFSKNDEVSQQRARIYDEENRQLGGDSYLGMPMPMASSSQQYRYSPPKYMESMNNIIDLMRYSPKPMKSSFTPFDFPRSSLLAQDSVMVNGERRSIHDLEGTRRLEEYPRRSVIVDHGPKLAEEIMKKRMMEEEMQNRNLEGKSSALDYSRRIRMEAGKSGIAAGMERARAEIQQIPLSHNLNIEGDGRLSTLTATQPNYVSLSPHKERYSYESENRLSQNGMVRSGDRNSVYMVGYV